ncbi:hypothetical protein chiPu_0027631, partial [Chiloscyllium punctatum]|nr:hypothetical protein [Chiloscyllium punctatum]
ESRTQRRRWAENRGELRHRPPARRLYGARAIGEELSRLNPPLSASGSRLSLSASLASLRRAPRPPSPTPSAARESLRPSLPSPTSSRAAFGEPAPAARQDHNRQEEKERKRQEKERARQEEKERKRQEKERARQEKERARQEAKGQEWRPLRAKGSKTENGARQAGTKPDGGTGALKDNYF